MRPYSRIEPSLLSHWATLANDTKDNLQIKGLPKGGDYDVEATIKRQDGQLVARGEYSSSTGTHAEIAALSNCPPIYSAVLAVNPPPCKRCAAVLAFYRRKFGFTIQAPKRAFAKTYRGAYSLPDFIQEDVIIADLLDQGLIDRSEAQAYKRYIISSFGTAEW